jgi:hypothetical protein
MPSSPALKTPPTWRKWARIPAIGLGAASLIGGLTVAAAVSPAGAIITSRYVAPSGSDTSNNCSSAQAPCLTLAHAYAETGKGNTIYLAGGTYAGNLTITKDLTIVGTTSGGSLDVNTTTINGGGDVLTIDSGVTVNIDNLVVQAVTYGTGDGIVVDSGATVNLDDVVVGDNIVNEGGGGLYVVGTLNMTGGAVSGNTVTDGSAGGGAYVRGKATFDNVTFTHDTATGTGAEGGALFDRPGSTVKLLGTIAIHDNSATVDGGGIEKCSGSTLTTTSGTSVTANTPNDISSADPSSYC